VVFYSCDDFNPEEIVSELRRRNLPNLWIPRAENFHKVDHVPMLGSGKLDVAGINKLCKKL
jgi:acyl-[acyl-carrier-protein]-phospholipid O-acyltransferase/long-chain-fatty-acid--[acyl-carrier-protein] ligase